MRGFCRSCIHWEQSSMLRSVGRCSIIKDMRDSLNTCSRYEAEPLSFFKRWGENFGVFWERTGGPIFSAATSSRKTLEMMIVFIMMFIAFAYMMIVVFPTLKEAFLNVLGVK